MIKYTLMHKNKLVADLALDEASGSISRIEKVHNIEHVPVGIHVKNESIDRGGLNQWWSSRAIPASRKGIKNVLEELTIQNTNFLVEKSWGLSLSDQYWIRPSDSNIAWEQVNFFQNSFSEDMGNLLFGHKADGETIDLMSPDNTSDGWLKKKWKIIDGKRYLIKGGSGATQQEPYNEVFASKLMERLGIEHVPYTLYVENGYPFSICEDFVTADTELITAYHIMQMQKKPNHLSWHRHFLNCCESLHILGMQEYLDRMIVLDFLIANEDRHQNNFGVIRNAETLEYLGGAPIYDSGTSLWFNKPWTLINGEAKVPCKPFKNSHEEQIKLVRSFDWLDLSALKGIDMEFREIVKGSLFIDRARCDAICKGICERVEFLQDVMNSCVKEKFSDHMSSDVKQDIAYSGEDIEKKG